MPNIDFLTDEDIQFLKELARELKTQDTLATAKPVFWQIEEKDLVVGFDNYHSDDICLLLGYNYTPVFSVKEAVNTLKDWYDYSDEEMNTLTDFDDIEEFCEKRGIQCTKTGYSYQKTYKNAFLTRKAIEEHIKQNHYHYKKPVRYCRHAFRNPELKRLLQIVEKFDGQVSSGA
ncbi:hypothetical protein [Pelotomaculum propionicicum]|uniref:Uncharacterized protein n=1 Tax=Pelotomaculum propionicicum TaxID=258475 RepID=A0A4Y7RWW8_9FIRM|nr:hypothetical protein [Pelotomaculum propionicicum]NLI11164.1 hypothetical protein [Peptococcaceae bacterium]TEB13401.1 hypothetical protein Pmgp_00295 [Pelotomaculum propionicicum]